MIYGNLTRDPEMRAMPNGNQVCSFGVATNRSYTDKDGNKQEQTEYHNVVAFGKLAEVTGKWLKKGRPVFIEGRLQTRSWDKDGAKQYRTEIIADSFQFGADGGARDGNFNTEAPAGPANDAPKAPEYPEEEINPEDIPF